MTVTVELGERSYDIRIEAGALDRAGELLASYASRGRFIVVTDKNIVPNQLYRLESSLTAAAIASAVEVLPPGESTKSWSILEKLTDSLLAYGVERNDTIIALGGGVIGDLVGFAASILKRGCRFVQVPTTLLSQVDTLPQRELRAGYAEVIKYGLIDDPAFFAWCESHGGKLLGGDPAARIHAITTSVQAKARIVGEDERETSGRRALLNLGHTFGHALEAETGFSDKLLHGEAVAAGMALAFRFSAAQGLCPPDDAERVTTHITNAGLPATLAAAGVNATGKTLVAHMMHDKKMEGGQLPFLLARGIGQTFLDKKVDLATVEAFLDSERG